VDLNGKDTLRIVKKRRCSLLSDIASSNNLAPLYRPVMLKKACFKLRDMAAHRSSALRALALVFGPGTPYGIAFFCAKVQNKAMPMARSIIGAPPLRYFLVNMSMMEVRNHCTPSS
jgi:hypothetical protein